MKRTIKKKKAFTLVELMGVLVIIGVLSAVLIPVISNVLKENKEKAYQTQLENIILATKNFVSDNRFLMPEVEGESISLTLGQLKKSGYTEHSIINPKTKQEISNCLQIEIQKNNNNYEYNILENTVQLENCNENYNSDILISGPSKTYVKNGDISSYILIINPSNEEQVLSYTFNDSKLSLGQTTDAKYSVVGENGIYKIIIKAGEKEDDIYLTFKEDAITDNVGNNIDMTSVSYGKIIVDNTAPVITFSNNGSGWTNNAKTKINVNDVKSGGNSSSYKYIFSNTTSSEPTNVFTINTEVSHSSGNGNYYLIAKACDNVGNCKTEISDPFSMDTAAPSVPEITLVYADNNKEYNQKWTNKNVKQIQSSSDAGVGGVYYEYGHDNSSWTSMPENWVISWDGSWDFYVRACDSLGNCSSSAPKYWIGRDTVVPTAPTVALVQWDWVELNNDTWYNKDVYVAGKSNGNDPTPSSSDDRSGIAYYQISSDNSSWNTWQYDIGKSLYYITQEGTHFRYIRAVDVAGNISSVTTKTIKIDRTAPVISSFKTYNKGEYSTYPNHQVMIFKITDNSGEKVIGYRSHCGNATSGANANKCTWASASTRLVSFIDNGKCYSNANGTDNKTIYFSVSNSKPELLLTSSIGKIVQYAFIICDPAQNCSQKSFTVDFDTKSITTGDVGFGTITNPDVLRYTKISNGVNSLTSCAN